MQGSSQNARWGRTFRPGTPRQPLPRLHPHRGNRWHGARGRGRARTGRDGRAGEIGGWGVFRRGTHLGVRFVASHFFLFGGGTWGMTRTKAFPGSSGAHLPSSASPAATTNASEHRSKEPHASAQRHDTIPRTDKRLRTRKKENAQVPLPISGPMQHASPALDESVPRPIAPANKQTCTTPPRQPGARRGKAGSAETGPHRLTEAKTWPPTLPAADWGGPPRKRASHAAPWDTLSLLSLSRDAGAGRLCPDANLGFGAAGGTVTGGDRLRQGGSRVSQVFSGSLSPGAG